MTRNCTFRTQNENPSGDDTAKRTLSSKLRTYLQECIQKHPSEIRTLRNAVIHFAFGCYFAWATYHLIELSMRTTRLSVKKRHLK